MFYNSHFIKFIIRKKPQEAGEKISARSTLEDLLLFHKLPFECS